MLNKENKNSYHFFDDENKMMLHQPYAWSTGNGEDDAIGRTMIAYYTYNDDEFVYGIRSCFELQGDLKHYQSHRYPTWDRKGISRDHVSYALIAISISKQRNPVSDWGYILEDIIDGLRWKLSDFASCTPDMWCWMKYLSGSKLYGFLYYAMEVPLLAFNLIKQKLVYKLGGLGKDKHPNEWVNKANRKWVSKLLMPIFAIHIASWQVRILPESKAKRILQKLLLGMTPEYNYVIRMLNGDYDFSFGDIENIKQMTGGMWTASLNENINDRDIHVVACEENCLDVDYIIKLWEERK